MSDKDGERVVIYTDGSCKYNPGPAGAAALLTYRGRRKLVSRYLGEGTNNIAELEAIRLALDMMKDRKIPIDLYTDSTYVIGVLTKGWKAKKNNELVMELREFIAFFPNLRLRKVKGHAGVAENELVDELAHAAADTGAGIVEVQKTQ